jgi:hypothetical protein
MKISLASGLGILAVLAAMTALFVLERRNRNLALEAQARAEALEREVAQLKSGRASAEEEKKRFTELTLAFADRAAKKHDLTDDQRKALVEVLELGRERISGVLAGLEGIRDRGDVDALEQEVNKASDEYKTWRLDELTKRLGPDIARSLSRDEEGALGDWSRVEMSQRFR